MSETADYTKSSPKGHCFNCRQPWGALSEIERLRGVLGEAWDYFDNRADISDRTDDDGSPYPNEEMSLLSEINEVLGNRS